MEPRFGYDFSNVRIHTDQRVAKSARSLNALAYTIENNIVFGEGQYNPKTVEGKKLLAHELTHIVQHHEFNGSTFESHDNTGWHSTHPKPEKAKVMEGNRRNIFFENKSFPKSKTIKLPFNTLSVPNSFVQRKCSDNPHMRYYETAHNYCQDSPSTS